MRTRRNVCCRRAGSCLVWDLRSRLTAIFSISLNSLAANSRSKANRIDIRRENSAINHLNETDLKKFRQIIRQTIVKDAIESYKCCVVLGGRPPPIDKSEKQLACPTRCMLSQLRSGILKLWGQSAHNKSSLRLRFQTDRSNATLTVDSPCETCHFPGIWYIKTSLLINVSLSLYFSTTSSFPSLFFLQPYHTCTSYSGYNNNNKIFRPHNR